MTKLTNSFSSLKQFMECPKKYQHKYIDRVVPVEEPYYFDRGKAWHAIKEFNDPEKALDFKKLSVDMRAVLVVLAGEYNKFYGDQQQGSNELTIVKPLFDGVELTGTLDKAGATDEWGQKYFQEYKSTTKDITPGSEYWTKVHGINPQADTYFWLLRDHSSDPAYCLWDVTRVPNYKRKSATPSNKREFYKRATGSAKVGDPKPGTNLRDETFDEFTSRIQDTVSSEPSAFFRREVLPKNDACIDRTLQQNVLVSQLMVTAIERSKFPCNYSACYQDNRTCEYEPVCSGKASLQDPTLYKLKPKREVAA